MLRNTVIIVLALFVVITAMLMLAYGLVAAGLGVLAVEAAALLLVIVFERSGYKPLVHRSAPGWEQTDETFIDPTTGETKVVYFNAQTGERDYR